MERMHTTKTELRRTYYYSPNIQRRPAVHLNERRRSGRKALLAAGAVLLVLAILLPRFGKHSPKATDELSAQSVHTNTVQPTQPITPTITDQQMTAKIQQIIAANPDVDISVSIVDLKSNKPYHLGTGAVFEAASVTKLLTAVVYLHQVEQGDAHLNDPVGGSTAEANMKLMIEQSDNTAWQNLNNLVTHASLLSYATSLGITNYDPEVNTMASDAIAKLTAQFYQGKLLNHEHMELLLGFMKDANATQYIKAAVPANIEFYHKAGWLEDRAHDAAIIDNGSRPYVLVIFTNGHANSHPNSRETVIHQITQATLEHFVDSNL
jgi:beta-lactamase class A